MELQAQLLRRFLTQFDSKEATSADEDGAYAVEFLKLKRQSTRYRSEKTYSTKAADRQENVKKNRYKDIVPFDHSRVKLSLNTSKNDTDYINANFIRESEENKGDYLIRILKVTFKNSSRTLKQLHYMNWPDHGIPDSISPILEMLQHMRVFQERDDIPICIHCSAGCGRTGVLCVIDYTWNLLKKQMIPEEFNIYDLVYEMRIQRPSIVQTKEQYELVYRAITLLFKNHLQIMESSLKQKEIQAAVPPIPEDTDSKVSDFSESEGEKSNPTPLHERGNEHQTFQTPEPYPRQLTGLGYRNSEILEPTTVKPTDFGFRWSQILQPSSVQPKDTACRNSQILLPPPEKPTEFGFQKSQIHQPSTVQSTDITCRNSQILEPPPVKATEFGFQKAQTPKPPRVQKADLEYQKTQTIEHSLLKQKDIECQKSHIAEGPPIQPTNCGYLKSQIAKPPRHQKADLGFHKPQTPEIATTTQTQNNDKNHIRPTPVQVSSPHQTEMNASLQTPSICLTVEDPYFAQDSFASARSTEEIPQFMENPCYIGPTSIVTTLNIEMQNNKTDEESPPPLPERTPESFIMADEASNTADIDDKNDAMGDMENKGVDQSLTLDIPSDTISTGGAQVTQAYSSLTPPLPKRTPDSFIVVTEEDQRNSAPCQGEPALHTQRLGTSSEWAGNSHLTVLPVMNRSKSVKVKSSKQECLSVPNPDVGASAEPVLSRVQDQSASDCRASAVEQQEIRSLAKKCRTKVFQTVVTSSDWHINKCR
ncbi:Tyrosine-protein phosphatase non-receptor type 22 [Bagarius yarrelli]|uniref:protein-tyrosine-phosphatase n=1 Tax=Bagarius yarrelli TaxID=175774 RepID=A0A556U0G6_BAGYA|nr:Tyrosine-protein phosphatase non-receptor type 22 [Bagarius yarrelli]